MFYQTSIDFEWLRRKEASMSRWAGFLVCLVVVVLPETAQAAPIPCFDFNCVNQVCEFDASCTTDRASIWKYHWIFGDGTSNLGGSVRVSHAYGNICYPGVTLELWTWSAEKVSVSCLISTDNPACPGPPLSTSGRCR
jgi:hypothetical protein